MNLLQDFHKYFSAQSALTGWTMFADGFKDTPAKAICVYEYTSRNPNPMIQSNTRQLQIVTRAETVAEARVKAYELFNLLNTTEPKIQLTETRWVQLYLRDTPFKLKVDEKGRTLIAFNITCTTTIN